MISCGNCGQASPEGTRFCANCGAALAAASPAAPETRKTVTVVFADITGSTELGERLDPEATRALLARYFAAMRQVLEEYGGTVEKFIGDAVMAVFGVPVLHEDDALRAVRAAHDMQARLTELNAAAPAADRRLAMRIGVNTGEVVAGAGGSQLLVTGDAVNVAARLEQAAAPGEVLIGATTEQLVHDAVSSEPVAPLAVKGKSEPLAAFRLTHVAPGRETRRQRFAAPLVGRQRELHLLNEAFARASAERAVHLFTLIGEPGVGKSRLVHELVDDLGERATVLRGRCLPYGEGITYWPIGEIVRAAAGITPADPREVALARLADRLAGAPRAAEITSHVAAAIGLSDATPPREEIFWAIRRLCAQLAAERPLVLVLDDLQWAEPTLVDLVEHLVEWSGEVPLMLLVMARPELFERQPAWGGGTANATTLRLQPLNADESGELIGSLAGAAALPAALRERVTAAAEGNPLFVEEFVAMLRDTGRLGNGDGAADAELAELAIPPTIAALISARLDRLEPAARDVIGRAAVVGELFPVTELAALTPERDALTGILHALVRGGLVRPDPDAADENAYRFGHLLIRDAAYSALPKERRAELHEHLANWLESTAGDRLAEVGEVIAHHLEQAYRYRTELDPEKESARDLAERAIGHLTAAAVAARERDDAPAAGRLFERAVDLAPAGDRRRALWLLDVGIGAERDLDLDRQKAVWQRMREEAEAAGAQDLAAVAELQALVRRSMRDPTMALAEFDAARERLEPVLREADDPVMTSMYWAERGWANRWRDHLREAAEDYERMVVATKEAHQASRSRRARRFLANTLVWGPTPASEVVERVEQIRREVGPLASGSFGVALAQLGRIEEARREVAAGRAAAQELGLADSIMSSYEYEGWAELAVGNLDAAERAFRASTEMIEAAGYLGDGSLAFVLARLGRTDEAAELAERARQATGTDRPSDQAEWRMALALVHAARGDAGKALRLAREAVELVLPTDMLDFRGDAHRTLADVLDATGRHDEAVAERREALRLYEEKGVLPKIAELRAQLAGD